MFAGTFIIFSYLIIVLSNFHNQVWNADESGLFWKRMSNRTYVAKSLKTAGDFKVAKDHVTLLFCSSTSGDRMMKPLIEP